MKRLLKYVPLHFLVFLILGIGIQFYIQIWTFGFLKLFFVLLFLAISLFVFRKKKGSTIIAVILFFSIGISAVYIQDARNFKNHYTYFYKEETRVVLKISKVLKPGFYVKEGNIFRAHIEECTSDFNLSKDNSLLSTNPFDNIEIVKTYPNAIENLLYIDSTETIVNWELTNQIGSVHLNGITKSNTQRRATIDTGDLAIGVYYLRVTLQTGEVIKKIISLIVPILILL